MLAGGEEKGKMYRNRHALVHQRLLRNPLFMPPAIMTSDPSQNSFYKVCVWGEMCGGGVEDKTDAKEGLYSLLT